MADITDLVKQIKFMFPTAADSVLELFIREGVSHFMQDTELFTARTFITGQRGIRDYPLAPPECHAPMHIKLISRADREDIVIGGYEFHPHSRVIKFERSLEEGVRYIIDYSYFLAGVMCDVPDVITTVYASAVLEYAKSSLHMIKDGGFFSPTMADRALAQYGLKVNQAISHFLKDTGGRVTIDIPWRI